MFFLVIASFLPGRPFDTNFVATLRDSPELLSVVSLPGRSAAPLRPPFEVDPSPGIVQKISFRLLPPSFVASCSSRSAGCAAAAALCAAHCYWAKKLE